MKIVYHLNSMFNPGGMERVTLNKAAWLSAHGWEVLIVTTDQAGCEWFYPCPAGVRTVDLGIGYNADKDLGAIRHTLSFLRRRRAHKKALSALLIKERADIVVSLYPGESSFIPFINDGSRKVLELHQNRFFHRQYANAGLKGLTDRLRELFDKLMVRKFHRFVVLTQEDLQYWGRLPNIVAIPNAVTFRPDEPSDCSAHRVIAAGRLDYQKSYDRLIDAWALIPAAVRGDWTLDIFGQGPWHDMLQDRIRAKGLDDSVKLHQPVKDIATEFRSSGFTAMSSHYEGFPMVLVEAMGIGLPAVSFDFRCGPRDMKENGVSGIVVPDGDIGALARAMASLMADEALRRQMGSAARRKAMEYAPEKVMQEWENCFRSIL